MCNDTILAQHFVVLINWKMTHSKCLATYTFNIMLFRMFPKADTNSDYSLEIIHNTTFISQ